MKSLILLASLAAFTNAYGLKLYRSPGCRSENLGKIDVTLESGCGRDFAGSGLSAIVSESEGLGDFGKVLIFFNGGT
jgi:hypothetical protein